MTPSQSPPARYEGTPSRLRLPAGTVLTRFHNSQFEVTEFNPNLAMDPIGGGRFDGTPDDPSVPLRLRTTCELQLVSLRSGVDLGAIAQDTWLTTAPASEYGLTRRWAAAIRDWAPFAQGLTWRSLREPDGFAYVLFGDRGVEACLEEAVQDMPLGPAERSLGSGPGRLYLEELLSRYRVTLM